MRKEKYEYMSKFCKIEEKKYIYYFIVGLLLLCIVFIEVLNFVKGYFI